MERLRKNKKGFTLSALVITVITILIIATVTIKFGFTSLKEVEDASIYTTASTIYEYAIAKDNSAKTEQDYFCKDLGFNITSSTSYSYKTFTSDQEIKNRFSKIIDALSKNQIKQIKNMKFVFGFSKQLSDIEFITPVKIKNKTYTRYNALQKDMENNLQEIVKK